MGIAEQQCEKYKRRNKKNSKYKEERLTIKWQLQCLLIVLTF